jgi:hypothetical protein
VKYTDSRYLNYSRPKPDAPKWARRGLEAYESFTNVFFLDTIMRVAGGTVRLSEDEYVFARKHMQRCDSGVPREARVLPTRAEFEAFDQRQQAQQQTPNDRVIVQVHADLLDRFRKLQLKARDGQLTEDDVTWMRLHMNEDERPEDFSTAGIQHQRPHVCVRSPSH